MLKQSGGSLCFIAASDGEAERVAEAISALFPEIEHLVFPPWDCLPYDRVAPTRHCMGQRMDALRIWTSTTSRQRLMLTSPEALLQRIAPGDVIGNSRFDLAVASPFDRTAFKDFIERTGYLQEGVADDPGELAMREGVIDIYPAGAPGPLRIVVSEDDQVLELRGFDRLSQRTESSLEKVTIGPASEIIQDPGGASEPAAQSEATERLLARRYGTLQTVFDLLGETRVVTGDGVEERVDRHLDIVADAQEGLTDLGDHEPAPHRSIYLDRAEWDGHITSKGAARLESEPECGQPPASSTIDDRRALIRWAQNGLQDGLKVLVAGSGKHAKALYRRLEKTAKIANGPVERWRDVERAEPGTLMSIARDLQHSFVDGHNDVIVIAAPDAPAGNSMAHTVLAEPDLRIGDVVVHEEHGVGVLRDLESIDIDGVARDAARLEYRDGGSILVTMDEFDRLWRYGSEAEAVSLDRLHTDAWNKKRTKIAADIVSVARHLTSVAKRRQQSQAEIYIPPRAEFSAFIRRFPFDETRDQADAIRDVLADLASGRAMNRLVCGDVGFGKTEIALRAAAAVALAGGQVVVVAPTTVLARQHFLTFQERFAGTGIPFAMLSRLVKASDAKQIKAGLADGETGIVVATQAILARDVAFARLGLLIVDEEHRFGLKDKKAMSKLAPSLHTLTMSATPIPRTLQSAMVGVQEVSLLTTPPVRRRPVRTALATFDRASMRTGLLREFRRGGQSFVVVPRIEDMKGTEAMLQDIVPELSIRVAHGKMPGAEIDEAIVGFARGDGDVLLATNIIENGLDVPRANTMFVWNADRFGLAQLHQLRGRVGRSVAQGRVTLLVDEDEISQDARARLSTLVESDRLGAGLAISLRDLDLRGGGDLAGEDQAGHMRVIGTGLYQKMLADAVAALNKKTPKALARTVLRLDVTGTIPAAYVSDPAIRLDLYAKLARAVDLSAIDDLKDELEDRFGEPPPDVLVLLRLARLQRLAARLGIVKLEAGPKALALTVTDKTPAEVLASMMKTTGAVRREDRLIIPISGHTGDEQLRHLEQLLSKAS